MNVLQSIDVVKSLFLQGEISYRDTNLLYVHIDGDIAVLYCVVSNFIEYNFVCFTINMKNYDEISKKYHVVPNRLYPVRNCMINVGGELLHSNYRYINKITNNGIEKYSDKLTDPRIDYMTTINNDLYLISKIHDVNELTIMNYINYFQYVIF